MIFFQNFKDLKISEEEMEAIPEYIPLKISSPEKIKKVMREFTNFANQTLEIQE